MDDYSSSSPFLEQYDFSTTDSGDFTLCSIFPDPGYIGPPDLPNQWRTEPTMEFKPTQDLGSCDTCTSTPYEGNVLQYLQFDDPDYTEPSSFTAVLIAGLSGPLSNEQKIQLSDSMDDLGFSGIDNSTHGLSSIGCNMPTINHDPQGVSGNNYTAHELSSIGVNMPAINHGHPGLERYGSCGQEGITRDPMCSWNNMNPPDWNVKQEQHLLPREIHMSTEDEIHTNPTGLESVRNRMDFNGWNESSYSGSGTETKVQHEKPYAMPSDNTEDCRGCELMREVVHSNGVHIKKLTIHGAGGLLYHAWLEREYVTNGNQPVFERTFKDLRGQSYESFKKFITNYGLVQAHEGYYVILDSLSAFVDALCTPISYDAITMSNPETCFSEHGTDLGETGQSSSHKIPTKRTDIAAQRMRTGKLHLRDLAEYFHLPIDEAAKKLDLCVTVLKKICRRYGMDRWPYRKIKGIDIKISKLQKKQKIGGGASTSAEIEWLYHQKAQIYDICGHLKSQKQEKCELSPPSADHQSATPDTGA